MRLVLKRRKSLYALHNIGFTGWDGDTAGNKMECMLMAMKGGTLLHITQNLLNNGKSMINGCTHMTTMGSAMANSLDSLFHPVNVSASFLLLMIL